MGSWAVIAAFGVGLALATTLLVFLRHFAGGQARAAAERLLAAREEQLRACEAQVEELRSQLQGREQERRAAEERAAALTASLARVETSKEALERRHQEAIRELDALSAETEATAAEMESLRVERTRIEARLAAEAEARALAGSHLDEKGALFLEQSHQRLEGLLAPLRDRLTQFEHKVEKTYDQDNRDRASLLEHLSALQAINAGLHHDAQKLSRALSGESRARGEWGEVVLERLLESAGLTEGREYRLQVHQLDEEGAVKRPDALVYLPGNRVVVIDAKCPLAAFSEAAATEVTELREKWLDRHVSAVRGQIDELSAKRYQNLIEGRSLDFVMMFIPSEAAFHAALLRRPDLYDEALKRQVHLCSPATLLASLHLVAQVWRSEKQTLNARHLAEEAARLLERLASFEADLNAVGKRLALATEGWEQAKKKLLTGRGSVRRHASRMVELGARLPAGDRLGAQMQMTAALESGVEAPAPADSAPEGPSGEDSVS